MQPFRFVADNEEATRRLGAALAELLPDGTTVALIGTLGAGKTRLVQAIAEACGVDRSTVMSPTFVLCHEYHGRRTIYHLDAYRLKSVDEFLQLGVDEYFESSALTLVEWGDRVRAGLPADCVEIEIMIEEQDRRTFAITAPESQERVMEALRARLA